MNGTVRLCPKIRSCKHLLCRGNDTHPKIPLNKSLIYEAHVKDLTILNEKVPKEYRGTYAAIASER